MTKIKHKVLARDGRYALIECESNVPPYVVCCGYCDKTKTWGNGIYFKTLYGAQKEYYDRINYACHACEFRHAENHPTWCMK